MFYRIVVAVCVSSSLREPTFWSQPLRSSTDYKAERNPTADTSPARQARLLYTLLHGVKADIDRYGVEFEVVVDK